jgi:hypothetical protein
MRTTLHVLLALVLSATKALREDHRLIFDSGSSSTVKRLDEA